MNDSMNWFVTDFKHQTDTDGILRSLAKLPAESLWLPWSCEAKKLETNKKNQQVARML